MTSSYRVLDLPASLSIPSDSEGFFLPFYLPPLHPHSLTYSWALPAVRTEQSPMRMYIKMPTLEQACLGCRPRAGLSGVQLLTPLFNLFKPQFPLCKMWPAVSRLWTPGSLLGAAKAGSVECAWQPHACPWVPHTSSIYPTEAGDVRKPDPAAPHAGARAEGPPL